MLLGDLLTYGHDVEEVIALVGEAQQRHGAELLVGNHDQMYFDLAEGKRAYFESLPDWLQDSVRLTLESPATATLRTQLVWSEESLLDDAAVASHANPFGQNDWRYLNGAEDHAEAASRLGVRSLSVGVFGHTHRPRFYDGTRPHGPVPFGEPMHATRERPIVINAGAVGQPRDGSGKGVILRLSLRREGITAVFEPIEYDVDAHVTSLQSTPLPPETIARLLRFFASAPG